MLLQHRSASTHRSVSANHCALKQNHSREAAPCPRNIVKQNRPLTGRLRQWLQGRLSKITESRPQPNNGSASFHGAAWAARKYGRTVDEKDRGPLREKLLTKIAFLDEQISTGKAPVENLPLVPLDTWEAFNLY